MNFKHQYIYSKRLGRAGVFKSKLTQGRISVYYPNHIRENGIAEMGQIMIGRNNVWIKEDQYNVIAAAEKKRNLKRKTAAVKDLIAHADAIISLL